MRKSGGQVADTGAFYDNSESQLLSEVKGAFYPVAGLVAHKVVAKRRCGWGDRVAVVADAERRARIISQPLGDAPCECGAAAEYSGDACEAGGGR